MELLTYLLKVSGCMAAFYIVYYTLLRRLTFFSLNRWYLLATLVVSLVIPAMHIGIQTLVPAPDVTPITINTTTKTIADTDGPVVIQHAASHINWLQVAGWVYMAVASLLLLKLAITLCGLIYKAIKQGKRQSNYRLVKTASANNSSFFSSIFLNDNGLTETEIEQVIAHELVHVKQLHSADNLFTEVLKALLWFNPFIYLYAKALHQAHEFEVDRHLADRYNCKSYAGLLLKLSSPGAIGLHNQFSAYGLKSRIGMLFGKPSAATKKLSYLLVVPVIAGLVYFLAIEKVYAYDVSPKNFVLVLDAGHGGKQLGVQSPEGIFEKDLNLQLVKQIKAIADERGIKTVLTRTEDKDVPLAKRLLPGDIFVSLHINWAPAKEAGTSGIKIITSDKNAEYQRSQNLAVEFTKQFKYLSGLNTIDIADQNAYVLRENKLPAIMIELGYASNKSDMQYLMDKNYRHDMAEKFVDAVIAYQKSSRAKVTGAVILQDTAKQVKVKPNTKNHKRAAGLTNFKDKVSLKIAYDDDENFGKYRDTLKKGFIYEFQHASYSAKDSTRYNVPTKTTYLYNGTVTTNRFHINAKRIIVNLKDSIVLATGTVHVFINDEKKPLENVNMDVDSLTIDLKNHPKTLKPKKG